MSSTTQGPATKGSKFQLQRIVAERGNEFGDLLLNSSVSLLASGGTSVEWRSPIKEDSKGAYYEYRDDFLTALDLARHTPSLREFWPKNGPQWDGLGIVTGGSGPGYLLVEAKAHPDETKSHSGATAKESVDQVAASVRRTQEFMGVEPADWTRDHYQLANRLCLLYFMNEIAHEPTWLLLVNFVNDTSHKPTTAREWVSHYGGLFRRMRIGPNARLLDRVVMVAPEAG